MYLEIQTKSVTNVPFHMKMCMMLRLVMVHAQIIFVSWNNSFTDLVGHNNTSL